MSGKVYANGLEIVCKVSKGKSVAAFPDPCWSPPSPPAGPVVIPYANTAYAKDLSNASKSVLIKDKPIAQKDKSFFKTSTGNEAATKAFGQGLITKKIKGKAYFTSWSMNVMVEGHNVARHTDLTTHNHGSSPGNTMMWPFVASSDGDNGDCRDTIDKANDACKVKNEKEFKEKQKAYNDIRKNNKDAIERVNNSKKHAHKLDPKTHAYKLSLKTKQPIPHTRPDEPTYKVREKNWKDQHCQDLVFKPDSGSIASMKQKLEYENDVLKELLKTVNEEGKAALKSRKNEVSGLIKKSEALLKEYKEGNENHPDGDKNLSTHAENSANKAEQSDCIKARKCLLVPYNNKFKTEDKKKHKSYKDYKKEGQTSSHDVLSEAFGDKRGCCPGQTGHHLIPHSWAKNSCENYDKEDGNGAPVVCVEGTHNDHGSHGIVHDAMDKLVERHSGKPIPLDQAIDMAAKSHQKSVGKECKIECTKAQLRHYYEKSECGNFLPSKKDDKNLGVSDDDDNQNLSNE